MPIQLDDLLKPIPGENPSGEDLRYEPVYDEIKEARREDDEGPQGAWSRERKLADWRGVVKLTTDAITKRSKDLQLAAWLTEALVRTEGIGGLRNGLQLIQGLLENFWDTLYPEIEDGDAEMRAAPLIWVGLKLDVAVKSVPLVRAGHNLFTYNEAQTVVGYEASVASDYNRQQARLKLIEEGKLSGEEWDKAFEETPKAFYKQLCGELDGSLKLVAAIDTIGDKFGDVAPSYTGLRKALEEVQQLAQPFLKAKLAIDPDPIEETPVVEEAATGAETAGEGATVEGPLAAEPVHREDAVSRVISAARFLRKTEPSNPAAYLLLRGLRWGELRAANGKIEPRLLVAPATALRSQLKSQLLDGKWAGLLETSETAMGQPCGRGWLDLQRYAIEACSRLGKDYYAVETALRAALRAFLADFPEIQHATMMDDTPTANAETLQWIAAEIESGSNGAVRAPHRAPNPDSVQSEAMDMARSGRVEEAVALLACQVEQERSLRARFRLRTQLAGILVEAGREVIAQPILDELLAQIDNFRLEDWENGQIVAEPMALLYRIQTKLGYDFSMRQPLYLRICRLDPTQALRCPQ